MCAAPGEEPEEFGRQGSLPDSGWSVVLRAKEHGESALASLLSRYRIPLLAFLGGRGIGKKSAEELVQEFSMVLLQRDFLRGIESHNGKFRLFLLRAFKSFLRAEALRVSLDPGCLEWLSESKAANTVPLPSEIHHKTGPNQELILTLLHSLVASALRRLEHEAKARGSVSLFNACKGLLYDDPAAASYAEAAAMLNLPPGAIRVAAARLRRRLAQLIRDEIRQATRSQQDLRE